MLVYALSTSVSAGYAFDLGPFGGNGKSKEDGVSLDGQSPNGGSRKQKKMNQVKTFLTRTITNIFALYLIIYTILLAQTAEAYVQNKAQVDSHHVIFDNLGKLSTGITYINVAIPLNISVMSTQIDIFDQFLDRILNTYPDTNSTNSTYLKHETINQQNMLTLVKSITSYALISFKKK